MKVSFLRTARCPPVISSATGRRAISELKWRPAVHPSGDIGIQEAEIPTGHPTSARLGYDIARGRAGHNVDFPDPAVAPLGTDDEAAGTPPSSESIKMAYDLEIGRPETFHEQGAGDHGVALYVIIAVGLAIGMIGGILLF
jgi:hypothetical protein